MTSKSLLAGSASSRSRHCRVRLARLNTGMTIEQRGMGPSQLVIRPALGRLTRPRACENAGRAGWAKSDGSPPGGPPVVGFARGPRAARARDALARIGSVDGLRLFHGPG